MISKAEEIVPQKRPMVFHEGRLHWYRCTVLECLPEKNMVKVSFDGMNEENVVPIEYIWTGSMKSKDWNYTGNGGWEPKGKKKKPKVSRLITKEEAPTLPPTPPLGSPHLSDVEFSEEESVKLEHRNIPIKLWLKSQLRGKHNDDNMYLV